MKTLSYSIKGAVLICTLSLLFTACKKYKLDKIASTAWSPELAVPLAIGEFNMYDIFARTDSTNIQVIDSQGAMAIVYQVNRDVVVASDVIQIPDQTFNKSATMASIGVPPLVSFSGTSSFTTTDEVTINNPIGAKLFTVDFKQGTMVLNASTDLKHSVKYDFVFPDLLENGVPLTRTIDLVYAGSVPQSGSTTVDISNTTVDLTNGPTGYNELRIELTLTISGSGNPITGTESIDIDVDMQNIDFSLLTADLGTITVPVETDSLKIKLFQNVIQGNFLIVNPSLHFKFTNSFGLPLELDIVTIKTIETISGNEFNLTNFPNIVNVAAAASPGQSAVSTLLITDQNSTNFQNILSPTPKIMVYEVQGTANPAGPATNFVKDDSKINAIGTLTMPMEGYATGFSMRDTIATTINIESDFVESALVRLNIENGLPIGIKARVYFVDNNYAVLKELTNGNQVIMASAPVNAAGKVTNSVQTINDFTINQSEIQLIKNTAYIVFEVEPETYQGSQGTIVKFYEDYGIKLRLGMQVQAKVKI